ncbi:unnamed protein product, partial [Rotaria magnacalcarata]
FDFNPNSVQSDEIIVEQEDEPLYTGAPVTFKSYHKQILEFGNSVKLSDSSMNTLLQLIGNALPIENKLLRNSSVKSDANSLLDEICDTIKQTVIVDNTNFVVNVLLFKADLSARALATKHEGVWYGEGRTVVYPYIPHRMNSRSSSHFDFCAEQVNQQLSCDNYYGIKGVSPLRKIMDIPNQIDIDIMHLCFIGHCNFLLCKWEKMIVKQSWLSGNDFLKKIKWPHNFNVELQSLSDRTYWKAHDYRSFLLYVMFPFVFSFFPENISSHFSLYFVFVRTLYFYHDLQEVNEVEQLIKIYCEHAQHIYGKAFYLYSSHAHLHLVKKVINNGAFCFHNCFPNESFVRFLRSLRSGNRSLAHQTYSSLEKFCCTIKKDALSISNIFLDEKLIIDDFLDREYISTYKSQFLDSVKSIVTSTNNPRRRGNTQSFIVSFHDDKNNKSFG